MSIASLLDILTSSTPYGLILKVTLLLLIAAAGTALIRRRSAAARHFVWALALGGAVALAVCSPLVPQVPVPIGRALHTVDVPSAVIQAGDVAITRVHVPRRTGSSVPVLGESAFRLGSNVLIVLWAVGAVAIVGWLMLGHIGLLRLTRRARRVLDDRWLHEVTSLRASLRLRRNVRLYSSGAVGAPITWGFLRPIVVLPRDAHAWGEVRRRVVLEHELAHVARHDYLLQMMGSIACALYWFHPLVWFAMRRLRSESERACDDAVLARGTSAADYAAHLLSVATGARALRLTGAVSIGMARQSALEGRLLAALNPTVARAPVSSRVRRYSAIGFAAITLPLAGLRAVPRATTVVAGNEPRVVLDSVSATMAGVAPVTQSTQDTTFSREFDATRGDRLTLDLGPGGDVEIRGWDENRVRVRATLGGLHWRDMGVELARDAFGVVLRVRFARKRNFQSTNNRYEIQVPRRYDVRLSSGGGNLSIRDVEGEFSGTTGGGEIVLERVTGNASLSTGGGNIRVNNVDMDGSVRTGGGTVTLSNVSGALRGHSGSGPVMYGEKRASNEPGATADISAFQVDRDGKRIRLQPGVALGDAAINISKAGGDVILEEAPAGAVVHTGGGSVRVGRSAGLVEASTGGGDVTIGPVAGSVIAGTGAGTITVTLADAGDERQSVEIHAGVGRVVLQLPRDFDGTFELETAYTRSFRRATTISSDWELTTQTTSEWDDRGGTPRRYVRAQGTAGRGRGRVLIKTTNGDISVRRAR